MAGGRVSATRLMGKPMYENSLSCPRCGATLKSKGGMKNKRGIGLCFSCSTSDPAWRKMAKGKEFEWTTDAELEKLERELEELCREEAS